MIFDKIENAKKYTVIAPLIAKGFDMIRAYAGQPPGRYEIDSGIYLNVLEYQTREQSECIWESHREYLDIQCVLSGAERVGYTTDAKALKSTSPYDSAGDFELLRGNGDFLTFIPGTFAIFFPFEPHMPGVAIGEPLNVKKIVAKIKLD